MRTVALATAMLLGCASHAAPKVPSEQLETRVVRVAEAHRVQQKTGDEVVGTLRARNVSALSPSVMGHVSALKVNLGSKVRAGELLVQLSADEISAKLGQANATFVQAEVELKRAQQLKASQTIPSAQYDVVEARYNVAKEALAEANVMRGYTQLRAPFAGVITAKPCEVGDLAVPGKPLLVLESSGAPRFEASVPEVAAQSLRTGQELRVRIDTHAEPVRGVVSELSPSADPQSRTVLVKLDLPEVPGLRPGMFGRLELEGSPSEALLIPSDAVVHRGQLELVYVVERGRARLRIVRAGRTADGMSELLSGLDAGEQVVISHPHQLKDGQPVEVRP
ncbi:MAG TPA: efflux RND transporter periplasmic adaptor subunit [Polyangiales bacterium]